MQEVYLRSVKKMTIHVAKVFDLTLKDMIQTPSWQHKFVPCSLVDLVTQMCRVE